MVSLTISNGGELAISGSAVVVAGPTNTPSSLGGEVVLENGSLIVSNLAALGAEPGSPGSLTVYGTGSFSGTLCVGLDTNSAGNVLCWRQLALTNGRRRSPVWQRPVDCGEQFDAHFGPGVHRGSGAGSQNTMVVDSSSWLAAEDVIIGEYVGATGVVEITSGQFIAPNDFLTLVGGTGSGQMTWSGSTVTIGALEIGANGVR